MNNNWVQSGSDFFVQEVTNQTRNLPNSVFKMNMTPQGQLYLSHIQDEFNFPYKVYGIEENFINRVITAYENTTGNLGVLLNGVKGTGKTVTAELICNRLNLPVIIINADFPNLASFLNDIQQDVIVLFDEFEKVFPNDYRSGSKLLSLMDGVLKTDYRKVFLLTTNNLYIDDNFVQRPGRIRYLKTFRNLDMKAIMEIIDDKLQISELRKEVIAFISQLELITVDIVSSIIQEVNIHRESPEVFADVFNVKKVAAKYNVYELTYAEDGSPIEKVIAKDARVSPSTISDQDIDSYFYINSNNMGDITGILRDNVISVVKTVEPDDDSDNDLTQEVTTIYRIEPVSAIKPEFYRYLDS
jgi:SpoVK/Ycf46/Vps4 family AAA+-type ATPase